jgi:hypothetical protein
MTPPLKSKSSESRIENGGDVVTTPDAAQLENVQASEKLLAQAEPGHVHLVKNGETIDKYYDLATKKLRSKDTKYEDGAKCHEEYDTKTGKLKSRDSVVNNPFPYDDDHHGWEKIHQEFDPKTGVIETHDAWARDIDGPLLPKHTVVKNGQLESRSHNSKT